MAPVKQMSMRAWRRHLAEEKELEFFRNYNEGMRSGEATVMMGNRPGSVPDSSKLQISHIQAYIGHKGEMAERKREAEDRERLIAAEKDAERRSRHRQAK